MQLPWDLIAYVSVSIIIILFSCYVYAPILVHVNISHIKKDKKKKAICYMVKNRREGLCWGFLDALAFLAFLDSVGFDWPNSVMGVAVCSLCLPSTCFSLWEIKGWELFFFSCLLLLFFGFVFFVRLWIWVVEKGTTFLLVSKVQTVSWAEFTAKLSGNIFVFFLIIILKFMVTGLVYVGFNFAKLVFCFWYVVLELRRGNFGWIWQGFYF